MSVGRCVLPSLVAATALYALTAPGSMERAPLAAETRGVELDGLWSRYEGQSEGQLVRFWYFHGDGHGLYRYGRVGLNNTHSFDYEVRGNSVTVVFRKTGEEHSMRVRVEGEGPSRTLRFDGDPREPGASYAWARGPISPHGDEVGEDPSPATAPFAGRMWMDLRSFATGGAGFSMYQFAPAAVDGRGVGWFHRGDFDEWSTEALTYRVDGENLELWFDLREELGISEFRVLEERNRRILRLASDPRDYWLSHRYRDVGGSFSEPHGMHFIADAAALAWAAKN